MPRLTVHLYADEAHEPLASINLVLHSNSKQEAVRALHEFLDVTNFSSTASVTNQLDSDSNRNGLRCILENRDGMISLRVIRKPPSSHPPNTAILQAQLSACRQSLLSLQGQIDDARSLAVLIGWDETCAINALVKEIGKQLKELHEWNLKVPAALGSEDVSTPESCARAIRSLQKQIESISKKLNETLVSLDLAQNKTERLIDLNRGLDLDNQAAQMEKQRLMEEVNRLRGTPSTPAEGIAKEEGSRSPLAGRLDRPESS